MRHMIDMRAKNCWSLLPVFDTHAIVLYDIHGEDKKTHIFGASFSFRGRHRTGRIEQPRGQGQRGPPELPRADPTRVGQREPAMAEFQKQQEAGLVRTAIRSSIEFQGSAATICEFRKPPRKLVDAIQLTSIRSRGAAARLSMQGSMAKRHKQLVV